MKKCSVMLVALMFAVTLSGCGKKQQSLEDMQQPMAPEDLNRIKTETQMSQDMKPEQMPLQTPSGVNLNAQQGSLVVVEPQKSETKLEPLPPSGPYKPSSLEIQTALRNAGYYLGKVDGKLGPMSKKAIEEFQKANGLKADGKVGPKTWGILSRHLNAATLEQAAGSVQAPSTSIEPVQSSSKTSVKR